MRQWLTPSSRKIHLFSENPSLTIRLLAVFYVPNMFYTKTGEKRKKILDIWRKNGQNIETWAKPKKFHTKYAYIRDNICETKKLMAKKKKDYIQHNIISYRLVLPINSRNTEYTEVCNVVIVAAILCTTCW